MNGNKNNTGNFLFYFGMKMKGNNKKEQNERKTT